MKHREHHPEVKFGLKCLLICKLNQKAVGHVLMTKFGKSKKKNWTIRFSILDCPVLTVLEQSQGRFEDPMYFEVRKSAKRHQGTKIEENQTRS
jgi:hypothetical protein